jgi:hypothetical protein
LEGVVVLIFGVSRLVVIAATVRVIIAVAIADCAISNIHELGVVVQRLQKFARISTIIHDSYRIRATTPKLVFNQQDGDPIISRIGQVFRKRERYV